MVAGTRAIATSRIKCLIALEVSRLETYFRWNIFPTQLTTSRPTMDADAEAKASDLVTLTRFLLADRETCSELTMLMQSVQLACKVIASAVRKAGEFDYTKIYGGRELPDGRDTSPMWGGRAYAVGLSRSPLWFPPSCGMCTPVHARFPASWRRHVRAVGMGQSLF